MSKSCALFFTCEHGGNGIPAPLQPYMDRELHKALATHRGFDLGALQLAKRLAQTFQRPLVYSETSRLVVDLNRSPHHRNLMSAPFKNLSSELKDKIIREHYIPYRQKLITQLAQTIESFGQVVHIACHSFTPHLDGVKRTAEIGLLYDPRRAVEKDFCRLWQKQLAILLPGWAIRKNYPYKGSSDGLTKHLRQLFDEPQYLGIELEINNRLLRQERALRTLSDKIAEALQSTLQAWSRGRCD